MRPGIADAYARGMTLRELQRACAQLRWDYQLAHQVRSAAIQLEVPDTTALEHEEREALIAYYAAHSALHSKLRERAH